MSGIAGIIRFDGRDVTPAIVEPFKAKLSHRGSITGLPLQNGIVMSFGDTAPVTYQYSSISIIADRDGFQPVPASQALITQYRQTGFATFNYWPGDFALALWDSSVQTLVLARDPLGTKPLYYVYQPDRFVAFASEIKALLTLPDVDVQPNEHKFREYLTWATDYVPYSAETFYQGIFSVLPGHCIRIQARQADTIPYWQIDAEQFTGLRQSEDWAEQFRTVFTSAIDQRIQGKNRVGSHLSGGLDSSAVSCVAQSLLRQQGRSGLHTFTVDPGLASTDESVYVQAVVEQWKMQQHTVHPLTDVLESVLTIHALFDRPEQFIIPSSFHLCVSLEAQKVGCDTILTGHDGDSVTATGFDWLTALLEQDDWQTFAQAARNYFAYRTSSTTPLAPSERQQHRFEQFVLERLFFRLKAQWQQRNVRHIWNTILQQQHTKVSAVGFLRFGARRIRAKFVYQHLIDSAFSADFNQRVQPRPMLTTELLSKSLPQTVGNGVLTLPLQQILNTTNVICNEQLNHIGAYYGHTYSFPFFDKHVVELGLATPPEISFNSGRGRGLLRNGLRSLLPTVIAERYSKANFVDYGTLAAQQLYQATQEQWASPGHPIWSIIDPIVLRKIVAIVFNDRLNLQKTRYNWLLSRIIYLALWLDSMDTGKRSVSACSTTR